MALKRIKPAQQVALSPSTDAIVVEATGDAKVFLMRGGRYWPLVGHEVANLYSLLRTIYEPPELEEEA